MLSNAKKSATTPTHSQQRATIELKQRCQMQGGKLMAGRVAPVQRLPSFGDAVQFDTMLASNPVNQRLVTMHAFESNKYAVKR